MCSSPTQLVSQTSSMSCRREYASLGRVASTASRSNSVGGQRDRLPRQVDLPAGEVDPQVPEHHRRPLRRELIGRPGRPRAAQHGLHAGDQLARAERLGEVVVRPDRQADQGVDLVGPGGEDEDVAVAERPQLPAHLDAVQAGQAQVEDHHVGLLGPGRP